MNKLEDKQSMQLKRITKPHKSKIKRTLFFWGLLFSVCLLGFGVYYALKRYQAAHKAADSIYTESKINKARDVSSTLKKGKPICLLLMGTDTGALGRTFKGRTDTIIVAVLNPKKK